MLRAVLQIVEGALVFVVALLFFVCWVLVSMLGGQYLFGGTIVGAGYGMLALFVIPAFALMFGFVWWIGPPRHRSPPSTATVPLWEPPHD